MRNVDIVKAIARMHEEGLIANAVIDAMLDGLVFKTLKGTGELADGMLLTPSGKVSFSLSALSGVDVAGGGLQAADPPRPGAATGSNLTSFGSSASAVVEKAKPSAEPDSHGVSASPADD